MTNSTEQEFLDGGINMEYNALIALLILMFAHWVGDFVLQTDEMATNKSHSNLALIKHTSVYSLIMGLTAQLLIENNVFGAQYWWAAILFCLIQFVTHTLIDYVTSRVNAHFWVRDQRHEFFTNIGLDQYIHFSVLIISFYYIFY